MRKIFLLFILLASTYCIGAEDDALRIAKIVAMGGNVSDFEANASAMADTVISQVPQLAPHKEYLSDGILELLKSDEMQTKVAMVYVENFTYEELLEFEKLLENPAMIAWLQKMPTVMPAILDVQRETLQPGLMQLIQNVPK